MKTAIVSVAYNRKDSLKRQLQSLEKACYPEPVTLVISVDKSSTTAVEDFAKNYHWPFGEKRVITHPKNLGTRRHIMSLGDLFEEFDVLIVLEDDITVSPAFCLYAKACAEAYSDDPLVAGISLYSFPVNYQTRLPFRPLQDGKSVFLMQCAQSWGEVWTRQQWLDFKQWYDENGSTFSPNEHIPAELFGWPETSWLKFHTRYCIERQRFFVYPYLSLSTNNQDNGVNANKTTTLYQAELCQGTSIQLLLPPTEDIKIRYDAFFEPLFLADNLGIKTQDLTVDFYGQKSYSQRFLLTLKPLPYKVVTSFALRQKPMEANIINGNSGNDIFLYDTKQSGPCPEGADAADIYRFYYGDAFYKQRTMMGPWRCLRLWGELIKNKLKK
jgi:glycosyltransferase involved in cell wall biosynthesis